MRSLVSLLLFSFYPLEALADFTASLSVILQTHGDDKYGRTLAEVPLPDGMNLNQELAGAGGTENMRQGIRSLKGWRRKRERRRRACELIRSLSHRESIAKRGGATTRLVRPRAVGG